MNHDTSSCMNLEKEIYTFITRKGETPVGELCAFVFRAYPFFEVFHHTWELERKGKIRILRKTVSGLAQNVVQDVAQDWSHR